MKKIIFLFVAISQFAFAQTKLFTMEEAVVLQRSTLAPAKLKQLMWQKNADNYSFIEKRGNEEVLVVYAAASAKEINALNLTQFNTALTTASLSTVKSFPAIQWMNSKQFTFEADKKLISVDITTKKAKVEASRDLGEEATNKDVAEKTNFVAFTVKNNLFVFDGKEKLIVTNDADENIVNGQTVHRDEFGIHKGTYWSPKGNLLAFYRMDQTMVTDYPVIDWAPRPAKNVNIKYPMAGDKSHEVTVGIYNVSTGKTVFLKTGEPKEQYLTNISWSNDEQYVYIAVLNRGQDHMKLNKYNVTTGLLEKTLFEEKHDKYVHPMHPMVFLPSGKQFIWQSERDGFNHLYLYNEDGTFVKQLTKGNWLVTDLAGLDPKGTKAYYTSTTESGITRNFYAVDLKSAKTSRITKGDGTHVSLLSSSGKYILDNFQNTSVPRNVYVNSTNGKSSKLIYTAANPIQDYKLGEMKIFTLKSESGDDLYCRLYKPVDFDSTKKYPTIVYLYNGPSIQMINNTWNGGGDLWFQYMAQRGFVVFTLDGRGSANRGLAFEQATFRHLGVNEMKDQMVGVDYLKKQKFVDASRMGIFGWSYGGFMTTSIMTRYPDVFKVGVAGGPVIDWTYYEVMYTERYMDTPQENPEGYKESRTIDYIDNLKGKLMLIHGAQDPTVVWQHSIQYLKACVDKKKQVDYFVYPGHEHNVLGKDREHLYQKVTDYFMQNL
ncbi:MAG: DPP IV N-terminal domain-containing protein [Bacteroidia bacterium]|nr:DPP IV N-terminal domain-containing protein [Bacteroidia bacterium]